MAGSLACIVSRLGLTVGRIAAGLIRGLPTRWRANGRLRRDADVAFLVSSPRPESPRDVESDCGSAGGWPCHSASEGRRCEAVESPSCGGARISQTVEASMSKEDVKVGYHKPRATVNIVQA